LVGVLLQPAGNSDAARMSYDARARNTADMTLKRPLHLWLLALTLVVGQWLAVVHGVQHQLNAGEQLVACETCVVGHSAAGLPVAVSPLALLPATIERPLVARSTPPSRADLLIPPPRGPPLFLA